MRAAFIVAFLANVILSLASLAVLPERVAIHFGPSGMPDGWASSGANTLMMLGMDTFLFCSFYFSPLLIARMPAKWISLPSRDYWLAPERRPRAVEMFSQRMWQFGAVLFLFLLVVALLALEANLSDPVRLDGTALWVALAVFFGYTLYWTIALVRAFRAPAQG